MSKFDPTPSQELAINERGHEIVVSAAAGSGKTTVLINRIINMLQNGECSVDELLVVTFTRAATAEIRSRLASGIIEKLKEDPKNEILIKQQMLVPSANIFTIDAFCANIVRQNFERAGVSPDFKILQGGMQTTCKKEALSKALAPFYEENSDAFTHLKAILDKGYNGSLENTVETVYEKMLSYKYPYEALDASYDLYKPGTDTVDIAIENFKDYANYLLAGLEKGLERFKTEQKIRDRIPEDIYNLETIIKLIENKEFEKAFAYKAKPKNWDSKFNGGDSFEAINLHYYRDAANAFIKENSTALEEYFAYGDKYLKTDLEVQLPALKKLVEIVKQYDQCYKEIKEEKNSLDFSDLEHKAYDLLIDEDGNKTDLAKDLEQSYKFILIDEYQDTNELQDGIFTALAKEQCKNLFIVGDVKQSIYGFRDAMPELFIEKKTHEGNITLGENFRSNAGVIEFVNFIFDQVMTKTCGDIDYQDKTERLVHGKDDEEDQNRVDVELHVIEGKGNSLIFESNFIIKYIKEEMEKNKELTYADFAILMRKVKGRGETVREILENANIPVIFSGGSQFLETADVKVMVSLLHAIDNPSQDVHMLATLMSPIFNFTPDDMALLRTNDKHSNIYSNLIKNEDNEKFKNALDTIRRYRQLSITMPVGELIRLIYSETLFPSIAASMPNGIQREANLLLLRDYADDYEQNNEYGISNFVRYIDSLIENEVNPESASLVTASTNAVKLMTIHKSKGLEFKYCFIMDLADSKSAKDHPYIIGDGLKIGIKACNKDTLDTLPSFVYKQIKHSNKFKDESESLRALYVGMTRAKEKLILIGSVGVNAEKKITAAMAPADIDSKTNTLSPHAVAEAKSYLDLILMAIARHPYSCFLKAYPTLPSNMPFKTFIDEGEAEIAEEEQEVLPLAVDGKKMEEIMDRHNYEYPYAPLALIPTKRSASATEASGFDEQYFANAVPEFLTKSKLTAAQKGTCLHRFMQFANYENNPEEELKVLVSKGYFTPLEAEAIDLEKVKEFYNSNIYQRIKRSPSVLREKKFAVLIPAKEFNENLSPELQNETVLIQGIADLVFEENGEYVILDYKTDRTTDEKELVNRYKDQLYTYKRALSDVLGKPICKCYLFSFSLGKEIEV